MINELPATDTERRPVGLLGATGMASLFPQDVTSGALDERNSSNASRFRVFPEPKCGGTA